MWPFQPSAKSIIKSISTASPFTPDKPLLVHSKLRLLFVCDDMMRPHKNYERIRCNSAFVSRGFTSTNFDFRIGKHTGRGLPFQVQEGLKIKGELHAVESEHILELDKHYQNGVQFARCRVPVSVVDRHHELVSIGNEEILRRLPAGMIRTVPERNIRHYLSNPLVWVVQAHMYVAIKKFWTDKPDGGFTYPKVPVLHPKGLNQVFPFPSYFKYPIDRNR